MQAFFYGVLYSACSVSLFPLVLRVWKGLLECMWFWALVGM